MHIWRDIAGFPRHQVSNWGWVRGPRGRIHPWLKDGYLKVTLRRGRTKKNRFVHLLVGEAFIGPRPSSGHGLLHNDGCRRHCALLNLRWGTRLENQEDRKKHGTFKTDGRKKLSVRRVRVLRKSNAWPRLAKKWGLTRRAAANARNGTTWRQVG